MARWIKNTLKRSMLINAALLVVIAVLLVFSATKTADVKPKAEDASSKRLPTVSSLSLSLPSDFTLRDKIGQLLMVGVTSESVAIDMEKNYQIGGFLIRPDSDLFSKTATRTVRKSGELPPFFAVDEEGGQISRLPDADFSQDSAKNMGDMSDSVVEQIAFSMGQSMSALGANIDFAPVTDLDNGQNAAISELDRSFSSSPAVVADKARAFATGLRRANIIPTFKHFPGLGNADGQTSGNTDTASATTPDLAALKASDLLPYKKLLSIDSKSAVMVGNQIVPGLTDGMPASLSKNTYDLLRKNYGFSQVTFTDELILAKAVANDFTPGQAVVAAIKAGADMPLIDTDDPQVVSGIIDAVQNAVSDGQITQAQINASLSRILTLKSSI